MMQSTLCGCLGTRLFGVTLAKKELLVTYVETLSQARRSRLTGFDLFEPNTISQTLSTVAGARYLSSFYADADTASTASATKNDPTIGRTPASVAQNGFPDSRLA